MSCICDALEAAANGSAPDAAAVSASIKAAHDALLPLLSPHVRAHNAARLTRVLDFYGNRAFAAALLGDDA